MKPTTVIGTIAIVLTLTGMVGGAAVGYGSLYTKVDSQKELFETKIDHVEESISGNGEKIDDLSEIVSTYIKEQGTQVGQSPFRVEQ